MKDAEMGTTRNTRKGVNSEYNKDLTFYLISLLLFVFTFLIRVL